MSIPSKPVFNDRCVTSTKKAQHLNYKHILESIDLDSGISNKPVIFPLS